MNPQLATIRIKNLRLRTYIGINAEEIANQQDVIINVQLQYAAHKALASNCIEEALNYRTICKSIIEHVEQGRFALLEKLTQEVLALVMANSQVCYAEVEIDKPYALRFADSVSVSLSATAPV